MDDKHGLQIVLQVASYGQRRTHSEPMEASTDHRNAIGHSSGRGKEESVLGG